MNKKFCDLCEREITGGNSFRVDLSNNQYAMGKERIYYDEVCERCANFIKEYLQELKR